MKILYSSLGIKQRARGSYPSNGDVTDEVEYQQTPTLLMYAGIRMSTLWPRKLQSLS
jgi:hypothetical protein